MDGDSVADLIERRIKEGLSVTNLKRDDATLKKDILLFSVEVLQLSSKINRIFPLQNARCNDIFYRHMKKKLMLENQCKLNSDI